MSSVNTVKEPVKKQVVRVPKKAPILLRLLDFISSVKFGVVLLCILVILSIVGMLIIQQNVNGFDAYYAGLTPAQKAVYGWLGLFDIYHSIYFNAILLVLSLNIVLASIDRFPSAWSYIIKPKLVGTIEWIKGRHVSETVPLNSDPVEKQTDKLAKAFKDSGFSTKVSRTHVLKADGEPTHGEFSIVFSRGDETGRTAPIPFDASSSDIREALENKTGEGSTGRFFKTGELSVSGSLNWGLSISTVVPSAKQDDSGFSVDDDSLGGAIEVSDINSYSVFGESGKWNRLGAYIVHVCLLTLFLGHFVALQTGFDADVGFKPGQTTDEIELIEFDLDKQNRFAASLPFTITCTDIQQKLIDPNGPIDTSNTLDWVTSIKIDDPQFGVTEADVGLNKPFSYRGYRFFQAQTIPIGNARSITLGLTPEDEEGAPVEITIPRNGSKTLQDGTVIKYDEFLPDFTFNRDGQPDTRSGDYNNPAAVLSVTPKNEQPVRVFAFAGDVSSNIPVGAAKAGYKWKLKEYEKSPRAHILSIKYDPFNGAFIAWYFGGVGLIGALIFVFFVSHKRVWAIVKQDQEGVNAVLGGDTNRNHQGFEDKFTKLIGLIKGRDKEIKKVEN
ncbi:MAG: hypothetical protein HKN33_05665 [Pyrinomonadaceae bacterium]|nr:hypothetical protein [Pyrinomonadaceae bacterium]